MPASFYGTALCGYPQYECIKVSRGQSWEKLFPDPDTTRYSAKSQS